MGSHKSHRVVRSAVKSDKAWKFGGDVGAWSEHRREVKRGVGFDPKFRRRR